MENGYESDCDAEPLGEAHSHASILIFHYNPTGTDTILLKKAHQSLTKKIYFLTYLRR